jgi:hypothetical protein
MSKYVKTVKLSSSYEIQFFCMLLYYMSVLAVLQVDDATTDRTHSFQVLLALPQLFLYLFRSFHYHI